MYDEIKGTTTKEGLTVITASDEVTRWMTDEVTTKRQTDKQAGC